MFDTSIWATRDWHLSCYSFCYVDGGFVVRCFCKRFKQNLQCRFLSHFFQFYFEFCFVCNIFLLRPNRHFSLYNVGKLSVKKFLPFVCNFWLCNKQVTLTIGILFCCCFFFFVSLGDSSTIIISHYLRETFLHIM